MKKFYSFIILCMLSPFAIFAQNNFNDADFFKSIFGVEKLTIVKEFITVDAEKEADFWSIYKAYEVDRKNLREARITIISEYAEDYGNFTEDQLEDLCKRSIKQKKKNAKNIEKYFKKLKKAGGAKAAAQFLQVENYFLSLSQVAVYESVPFIGELDKVQ